LLFSVYLFYVAAMFAGAYHRVKYIFYLESIRPIRTAENFEAVEWATGFSNKNGCIVGLIDTAARSSDVILRHFLRHFVEVSK